MKRCDLFCDSPGRKDLFIIVFAALCFLIGFTTLPAYAADDFKVTLLGTGTPTPLPDRFGPSTLVEVGGKKLLFDFGRGATIRLNQLNISIGKLDVHFLTHLHSDHINGLMDVWTMSYLRPPTGGRTTPFVIYGPAGTAKMMAALYEAIEWDRKTRQADEQLAEESMKYQAYEVKAGDVAYSKDGIVVTAFETNHGDLIKPTLGFKVAYGGHSVVLSGDSRYNENVKKAATGADLMIHSVAMVAEPLREQFKQVMAHHITPEEAGKLFAEAKPKMAAFHHFVLLGNPRDGIMPPTADNVIAAARTTYGGPMVAGIDLMSFKIDGTGVSVIEPTAKPDFQKKK